MIAATWIAACLSRPSPGPSSNIQFVQSKSEFGSGISSQTATFDLQPHESDLVVAVVGVFPTGQGLSISDTAGNLYQPTTTVTTPSGSFVTAYYAKNVVTATPFTVIVTVAGAQELTLAIHEYSGADRGGPLDQQVTNRGSTDTPDSGMVTTAVDGELYFAVASHDATSATKAGSGYVQREIPTDNSAIYVPLATEDKIGPAQTTSAT